MYNNNGTFYTEEHSVSFGNLVTRTSNGVSYTDFATIANSWEDWHLIPSSRLSVAHPNPVTKFIEIPGSDGVIDLTDYLAGRATYGQRSGSFSFYIDNDHEYWENLREKMVNALHGKRMKMRLMDDPGFYYEGRFTVGNYESGADHSSISISYQLDPYKLRIQPYGSDPVIWDTFNFESDYDYSVVMYPNITVSGTAKTFTIYSGSYSFIPTATWVSGSVGVSFGGVTKTLSAAGSATLGGSSPGSNTLRVTGTGSVKIQWRGGSL